MAEQFHERQLVADLGEFEFRKVDDGDGLTVLGYITRFGEPTVIDDWLGQYTEEIKRGAFAKTLQARGPARVKMQFDHGHDLRHGSAPIGVWEVMREDKKGLYAEGRIHDTWDTIPIRAGIESGALDGMSFRFKVVTEQWRKATKAGEMDHRTLTEVNLYEAGPVVFPAYEGSSVGLRAFDLVRQAFDAVTSPSASAIVTPKTAVAPGGDTDPEPRTEADPAGGITRQQMCDIAALALLGVFPNEQDRVA
jgi:HK97 family phage prohead protease